MGLSLESVVGAGSSGTGNGRASPHDLHDGHLAANLWGSQVVEGEEQTNDAKKRKVTDAMNRLPDAQHADGMGLGILQKFLGITIDAVQSSPSCGADTMKRLLSTVLNDQRSTKEAFKETQQDVKLLEERYSSLLSLADRKDELQAELDHIKDGTWPPKAPSF